MTVSSETSRKTFVGNGATTSFGTSPMIFFASSDLKVYVVTTATGAATLLVENTHYTVSGGSGSTGTVDLAGGSSPYGAPAATQTLVIVRSLDLVQEVDFVNNEASDAEVVEDALDKLTIMTQQLSARLDRTLSLSDSDVTGANPELPTPVANTIPGWDAAGTALENKILSYQYPVSAYIVTLLDDADAATAQATLKLKDNSADLKLLSLGIGGWTGIRPLEILSTGGGGLQESLMQSSNDTYYSILRFARLRAGGAAAQDGDVVGGVKFSIRVAGTYPAIGEIIGVVDGTPGADDGPGRIALLTTPDGASAPIEAVRIDNAQRLIIGNGSALSGDKLSIKQGVGGEGAAFFRYGDDVSPAAIRFHKTRNTSVASHTVVQASDSLATIAAYGSDGSAYQPAASILFSVDGTPGANDMPGAISFRTTPDGGAASAEAMAIRQNRNVTMQSMLDLSAAGAGRIKFPATQNASADANTLDDYEEGTWTPTLTFSVPGNLNVVYSARTGTYVKIGRAIRACCLVATSTFTHTTASGDLQITGLPHAANSVANHSWTGACYLGGYTAAGYTHVTGRVAAGTSLIDVVVSGTAVSPVILASTEMPTGGTVNMNANINYDAAN